MKRLKGPSLKTPELKLPVFLVDLYYDLRDRRLLPLVALVLVAIVAAPFLLSAGSEEKAVTPATAGIPPVAGTSANKTARLTVVEAKPGLRDYRKRLRARTPTDPFEQRYSGPVSKGGQLPEEPPASATPPASGGEPSTTPPPVSETPPASSVPPSSSDANGAPSLRLYTFAIDVQIAHSEPTKAGGQKMGEPTLKRRVLPTAPLPGEKAPVVTYMGLAPKGKNLLLMVSNNVKTILGDAKCLSGTDTCQLLEVEPGLPEAFVYGDNDVRYKINILKVEAVPTGHSESGQKR